MKSEPRRLRFDPFSVLDAPFQVLENAFWRPHEYEAAGKTHSADIARERVRVSGRLGQPRMKVLDGHEWPTAQGLDSCRATGFVRA
jgi:hypothetical protein